MEQIHPHRRFSVHADSVGIQQSLLQEALRRFGLRPRECTTEQLSGGFMNANFKVSSPNGSVLLRIYSTNEGAAERERDLLQLLEATRIKVPRVIDLLEVQGRKAAFHEFVSGITLQEKLLVGDAVDTALYTDIGAQLGLIHQVLFEEAGFIAAGARPGGEYENFGLFIKEFVLKTLEQLPEEKLASTTNARLRALVMDQWGQVLAGEPLRQLCHCDFNPKNIMVVDTEPSQVAAVVDWEFCLSGNGLVDLGNFFRFAYDYAEEARSCFVRGYEAAHGKLPADWANAARLLDLGNMCSFLERREDYQRTFRTARTVIESTLQHFGY